MASGIPLNVPITITERRAYTAKIFLCEESAELDTAYLYVYALPQFIETVNIAAFNGPLATKPSSLWFSAGDLLYRRVGTRAFTNTQAGDLVSGTYPIVDRVAQAYNSGLPWTYANKTLTVTFNYGAALPSTYSNYDQLDPGYVPLRYLWSAVLVYEDGTNVRIVDSSQVKIDIPGVGGSSQSPPPPPELVVCSSKVA